MSQTTHGQVGPVGPVGPAGSKAAMVGAVSEFRLHLDQVDGYEFRVRFEDSPWPDLVCDEPPPLGRAAGPNPARLLAASIAHCLAASLMFCASKKKVSLVSMGADVVVQLVRNERRRLRIGGIKVILHPEVEAELEGLSPCLAEFEDFCLVTESVREGVPIEVVVEPISDQSEGPSS